MIDYRILHELIEFEALVDLEIVVWGLNPRDSVSAAMLHVMALNGGLVMGAFDGERMVGLLVSMAVRRESEVFLWSHMTGTHPDYQRQGIGLELKRRQRQWARANDYSSIRWTVDPLQRGNAWFNLRLLGQDAALSFNQYHVNFYGEMTDDINRGLPSDRIELCWEIDQPSLHLAVASPSPKLICLDADGRPSVQDADWDSDLYCVPVPADLKALRHTDPESLLAWRMALREALTSAFAQHYVATDFIFIKEGDHYMYLLRRQE